MASTSTQLPNARLVVTGHAPDGTSIFTFDNTRKPFAPFGPTSTHFTNLHADPAVPASNTAPYPELSTVLPRCPPEGVLFCITDIQPGASTPLHRTLSTDYAAVLSGEIVLRLDSTGAEKTLRAGDVVVQRGASHAWTNRTQAPCRILIVKVAAEPIVLADGTALEARIFGKVFEETKDKVSEGDDEGGVHRGKADLTEYSQHKVRAAGALRSGWFDDEPSARPPTGKVLSIRHLWTTFHAQSRVDPPPSYSP
ncbi:hypothetical protein B0H11DRAFT_1875753 [Mycena galericulata]|nr:hypothetical protein B0H11DRAFT_1875753 [Mycena galericulata]